MKALIALYILLILGYSAAWIGLERADTIGWIFYFLSLAALALGSIYIEMESRNRGKRVEPGDKKEDSQSDREEDKKEEGYESYDYLFS